LEFVGPTVACTAIRMFTRLVIAVWQGFRDAKLAFSGPRILGNPTADHLTLGSCPSSPTVRGPASIRTKGPVSAEQTGSDSWADRFDQVTAADPSNDDVPHRRLNAHEDLRSQRAALTFCADRGH